MKVCCRPRARASKSMRMMIIIRRLLPICRTLKLGALPVVVDWRNHYRVEKSSLNTPPNTHHHQSAAYSSWMRGRWWSTGRVNG